VTVETCSSESIEIGDNSLLVNSAIQLFGEQMADKFVDEAAVVYIIGAFSAGKSRLVRELLRSHNAVDLLPISSQERQSALQVEITYGLETSLVLVNDENEQVKGFSSFPSRQEQQKYSVGSHYLRLEVPEPALSLGNIALLSDEEGSKRLLLKDMPGWNSGDSYLAEDPLEHGLVSANNLSLVYVVRANGVDSQDDLSRLEAIFTAVEEGEAYFYNGFNLVVVVTRCEDLSEYEAIRQRLEQRFQTISEQIELDEEEKFQLTVLCVDFGKESEQRDNHTFIEQFWQAILLPVQEQKQEPTEGSAWERKIRHWPAEWSVQAKLVSSLALLDSAKKAMAVFKQQDQFVCHMNRTRLLGLSNKQRREKVLRAWQKQVGEWQPSVLKLKKLKLSEAHPLAPWWNDHYWLRNLSTVLGHIDELFSQMKRSINALPNDVPDLQTYFEENVGLAYLAAEHSLRNSFYRVGESLESIQADEDQAKMIATLLSLSVMDAKYSDYLTLFETT